MCLIITYTKILNVKENFNINTQNKYTFNQIDKIQFLT